jgi:ubiquinone biosynthesis protein
VFQALQSNAMMQHQMQQHNQEMAQLRKQLQSNNSRTFWTIITSSLLIGAAVLLPSIFN